jgi:raffinose/stachyose/melibiose transport system permease protein
MTVSRKTYQAFLYALCIVLSAIILVPFAMMFVNSFKDMRESALFRLTLPTNFTLENYINVLSKPYFWRGLRNSLFITSIVTFLVSLSAAMAAFIIQRKAGKLGNMLYFALFAGIIVPVSIIPTIQLMMQTRIHNTFLGIILFYTAINLPFSVFLLTGFMKTVPREIDEAAMIEGCSYTRLFVQLIIPLLRTPLVTCTIVTVTNVWNDFQAPFYLISDSRKWPIVISIYNFVSQYYTNWGSVFAFMMMAILPVLTVYALLQKHIIAGLTTGAVKG